MWNIATLRWNIRYNNYFNVRKKGSGDYGYVCFRGHSMKSSNQEAQQRQTKICNNLGKHNYSNERIYVAMSFFRSYIMVHREKEKK